jgi:hypothetical protein
MEAVPQLGDDDAEEGGHGVGRGGAGADVGASGSTGQGGSRDQGGARRRAIVERGLLVADVREND